MPFADSKNFDDCINKRMSETGYSEETAKKVCGKMKNDLEKSETPVKEWEFNPNEILSSPRKVKGIFHQPVVDKDGEIIMPKGMRESIPNFMHFPALHDFHKERPVGLATKIKELSGGRFYFEGVLKATPDCDDVWEKVQSGNYNQVSIFGKRTKFNNQCSLPQGLRTGPCVTDGVRLDSISVCDLNARNPQTSLEVKKAKVVYDMETIVKAETAGESPLMHQVTDYPGGKVRIKKCPCPQEPNTISKDVEKADGDEYKEEQSPSREMKPTAYHKKTGERIDSFGGPMKETGSEHSKRTKSGYPLRVGKNEPPKSHKGDSDKPRVAPRADWKESQARSEGAAKHTEKQVEAGKKMLESQRAKKLEASGKFKAGNVVRRTALAHKPKRGEEHMTSPHEQNEKGTASSNEQTRAAAARHRAAKSPKEREMEKARPTVTEEPLDRKPSPSQRTRKDVRQRGEISAENIHIEKADEVEKGAAEDAQEEMYEDDDYEHVKHTDKDGQWNKNKDPNGTVKMTKAKKDDEDDEDEEGDDDDSEDVEKGITDRIPRTSYFQSGDKDYSVTASPHERNKIVNNINKKITRTPERAKKLSISDGAETRATRSADRASKDRREYEGEQGSGMAMRNLHKADGDDAEEKPRTLKKGDEDASSELFDPSTVTKGEMMDESDDFEQDVEYVTKALVPIEEIDTLVKARTEEISKAYACQIDEIKKAYDDRLDAMQAKLDKMENETIVKGGQIVVIPELLGAKDGVMMSNADAIARLKGGQ